MTTSKRRFVVLACLVLVLGLTAAAAPLPSRLNDQDFWRLVSESSEPDGTFRSDNLLSNELGFQFVVPELTRIAKPGRVYMGVGPEQNFTYIVATKPAMAFIVDIRRGNLDLQLMYKALFELSADRAEFVSRLFSKKRPEGLGSKSTSSEIFGAFWNVSTDLMTYNENLQAIDNLLVRKHGFALSSDDLEGIKYVYNAFFMYGPKIQYSSTSSFGGSGQPTYADLMTAADLAGLEHSYLASEENFQFMKDLEARNMLVPVIGNFGGAKAIRAVGRYLRDRSATVSTFYLSNVEQYLRQDLLWDNFCANVATLPLDETSKFIRSVRRGNTAPGIGLSSELGNMSGEVKSCRPSDQMPLLLLLFIGSGCAALIYEIVWFQLLQLVIGSSVVSLGVLLGTFMGGMCLGSFLLPRAVSPRHHPLRVYAALELGIGIIGLLILWGMPLIGGLYTSWAGPGVAGLIVRGLVAAVCLLPPTLLMGATLPAVARWVETTPQGVSWLGFFYGGNIAGAVVGSLMAGFYLLRVYDTAVATYVAVALNVLVAAIGFAISRAVPAGATGREAAPVSPAPGAWAVYVAIGLSGATALAAEVIWTRILSLLFGATVYTFSLILAVFLIGLGIGSSLGAAIGRGLKRPRVALGICQLLLCAAIAWTAYVTTSSLPYWPINPSLAITPWFTMQLDLVLCLWAVLPAAILWGASFPLALASVASPGQDPARLVGGVYAANTVGAIVGSLAASFVLVAWIGSQHAQQVLIVTSLMSALLVLAWGVADHEKMSNTTQWLTTGGLIAGAAVAVLLARTVPEVPGVLIAYGRYTATRSGQDKIIYKDEGMMASVAVSEMPNGVLNYHNAGKIQASSQPEDMRLQRMLGHLTTLVHPNARRVVVIGCGAGVTAGAVSIDPAVESETIAEIEPLVPRVVSTYFSAHNFDVVRNPKVHIQIDDGRHYVATLRGKFDALTSDPLDPWVKGAAMLYTREFFEDVKAHLNPGGVVTLFVQLYESNTDAVKSEIGTFFEAFPNGMVFGNTNNGVGYDLVLFGQVEPTTINLDAVDARLKQPEYAKVAQSLREIGFNSAVDLFSTYAGSASDLKPWLKNAPINRDRNLRLQYLAGLGLNLYQSGPIYAEMLTYRTLPQNLFVGSDALKSAVMAGIQAAGRS